MHDRKICKLAPGTRYCCLLPARLQNSSRVKLPFLVGRGCFNSVLVAQVANQEIQEQASSYCSRSRERLLSGVRSLLSVIERHRTPRTLVSQEDCFKLTLPRLISEDLETYCPPYDMDGDVPCLLSEGILSHLLGIPIQKPCGSCDAGTLACTQDLSEWLAPYFASAT